MKYMDQSQLPDEVRDRLQTQLQGFPVSQSWLLGFGEMVVIVATSALVATVLALAWFWMALRLAEWMQGTM
jgi:hypothetical protein